MSSLPPTSEAYHVEPDQAADPTEAWKLAAVYTLLAISVTWPAVLKIGSAVPGAQRGDLWNTLWSLNQVREVIRAGSAETTQLGWPGGGLLLPADLLNGLLVAPLMELLSLPALYSLLVMGHLIFAGWAAHRLAEAVHGQSGWIAGVAFASSPILISGIHNGTSEAMALGWIPLSGLGLLRCWRAGRWGLAGLAMALCVASNWYNGVCAGLLWASLLAMALLRRSRAQSLDLCRAGGVSLLILSPLLALVAWATTHPSNLLGIKDPKELLIVRRNTGPADLRGWWMPGDWRSPDFRELSIYAEEFIHCHYLGWVLVLLALRIPWTPLLRWIAAAGLTAMVLATGPVITLNAQPWVFGPSLVFPLPYALLELLPGFSSLSLLYRLGALTSLALAVLAAARPLPAWARGLAAAAVLAEFQWLSPVRGFPQLQDARPALVLEELRSAPEGAVMNFPVAGGRPYLYHQLTHQHPLASSLNFPVNAASKKIWSLLIQGDSDPAKLRRQLRARARQLEIRYLIVHQDASARPDVHTEAVKRLRNVAQLLKRGETMEIYQLW